jgi:hypothetical protein
MPMKRRKWTPSLRQRGGGRGTDRQGTILTAVVAVLLIAVPVAVIVRYVRSTEQPTWPFTVPWDPSWPSLPVVSAAGVLSAELAQAVYALVATNEDTLKYIPCYCGCRSQGHGSVHHCHVKRRSADGHVAEWNDHGRICPMSGDIAGDAVLWHQRGRPLKEIRAEIEREYSSRGPATPTPAVPNY